QLLLARELVCAVVHALLERGDLPRIPARVLQQLPALLLHRNEVLVVVQRKLAQGHALRLGSRNCRSASFFSRASSCARSFMPSSSAAISLAFLRGSSSSCRRSCSIATKSLSSSSGSSRRGTPSGLGQGTAGPPASSRARARVRGRSCPPRARRSPSHSCAGPPAAAGAPAPSQRS
ncbi:uncharacterized protein Tco025E_09248, partial [Trypanosoma conorhini]